MFCLAMFRFPGKMLLIAVLSYSLEPFSCSNLFESRTLGMPNQCMLFTCSQMREPGPPLDDLTTNRQDFQVGRRDHSRTPAGVLSPDPILMHTAKPMAR